MVLFALVVASVPLARAAHQSSTAGDIGGLVAFAAFGSVGVVVAVRQPRNVMGWILLGIPVCQTLNTDMSAYAAIDYRVAVPAVWMIGAYGIATDTILLHKIVIDATG